jgi:uncharacterized protein YjbI with pentapeptide repeats
MQIIKPNKLSLISKTYGFNGNQFAVGALCFFKLGENNHLLTENSQWPKITEYLNNGILLDMGFAKSHGEMLVAGKAFTSGKVPTTKMNVSIKLGNINKRVKVIGDRRWTGSFFSPASIPKKFTEMPLIYQNAYGACDYGENPLGKGLIKKSHKKKGYYSLPNIYSGSDSTQADKNKRNVAGFGPLDICWPQRACYQGTYDQHWLENDHPGFPKNTDTQLFNAAPLDQQINGYFQPGETYQIKGMNAEHQLIKGQLPQIRVRAFIKQQINNEDAFKEIHTAIDTVWFFPELEMGVAIYRGVLQVNDSDGLDVKQLMLACEGVNDKPRTIDYFEHVLSLRTDPDTALAHVFNESQLMPIKTKAEQQHYDELYVEAKRLNQQKVDKMAQLHLIKIKEENPTVDIKLPTKNEADKGEPGPIPQALLDSGDIDLSPFIEHASAAAEKAKIDTEKKLAQLKKEQLKHDQKGKKETESTASMQERVNNIVYVTATDLINKTEKQKPNWLQQIPKNSLQNSTENNKIQQAAQLAASSARQARQSAPSVIVLPLPLPENGALQMRAWVIELMNASLSLAGRDLAGADLSGLDFSHMDMRDVMLEQANLTACNFTECRLDGAVFTAAIVDSTIFTQSSMTAVNLSLCHGEKTNFTHTNLTHSNLTEAVFEHCDFSDAIFDHVLGTSVNMQFSQLPRVSCEKGNFVNAKLAYSDWQQASFSNCIFLQPELQSINWQGVKMERCIMIDAKAEGANLSEIHATKVQFSNKGDFRQANMSAGRWLTCGFRCLDLTQCNGSGSAFIECDFGEATLEDANFNGALFNNCIMTLAKFNRSDCRAVYFNGTSLRKSQFIEVDLRGCEMVNADMTEVLFKHCLTKDMSQRPLPSIN